MYSMWGYHNKALREHPEYQMEGMMDCLREEMSYYLPYPNEVRESPERVIEEPQLATRQEKELQQLKAEVLHYRKEYPKLLLEIEKLRGLASKGKGHTHKLK